MKYVGYGNRVHHRLEVEKISVSIQGLHVYYCEDF